MIECPGTSIFAWRRSFGIVQKENVVKGSAYFRAPQNYCARYIRRGYGVRFREAGMEQRTVEAKMAAPHSGAARPSNALRMLVPLHSRSTADRNLNYPTNQLTVTLALRLRLPPRRLYHRDRAGGASALALHPRTDA